MKDQELDPQESVDSKVVDALLNALTGKATTRPRQKTALNVWRKTERLLIEERARSVIEKDGAPADQLVAVRLKIAQIMFDALSPGEKAHWKRQAQKESDEALQQWKLRNATSSFECDGLQLNSKDRQFAIHALARVAKLVVNCIEKTTGWKATLITGGPEPARGGQLNIMSVHAGQTSGDAKMDFVSALGNRYRREVVSCFEDFLEMCYTPQECQSLGLNPGAGYLPLRAEALDESTYLHPVRARKTASLEDVCHAATKVSTEVCIPSPSSMPLSSAIPRLDTIELPYFHSVSTCASVLEKIFHRHAVTTPSLTDGIEETGLLPPAESNNTNRQAALTPRPSHMRNPRRASTHLLADDSICENSPASNSSSPSSTLRSTAHFLSSHRPHNSARAVWAESTEEGRLENVSPPMTQLSEGAQSDSDGESSSSEGTKESVLIRKRGEFGPGLPTYSSRNDEDSPRPSKRQRPRRLDVAFLIDQCT